MQRARSVSDWHAAPEKLRPVDVENPTSEDVDVDVDGCWM